MNALEAVVLLGPPGSGKGTQAARLASDGWTHVSTGDLFREQIRQQSDLGLLAAAYIDHGELVPDTVTTALLRDHVVGLGYPERLLLDGFPRTTRQADALDDLLASIGYRLRGVVTLEVDADETARRIAARRTCAGCGAVYGLAPIPRVAGRCDRCSGALAARSDERPETVVERLRIYRERTAPLIERYARHGLVLAVDGFGSVDAVAAAIKDALAPVAAR